MVYETISSGLIEPEFPPDLSTWQIGKISSQIMPFRQNSNVLKRRLTPPTVSSNIDLQTADNESNTFSMKDKIRNPITSIQAYDLALDTLKSFEEMWGAYVEEEASNFSAFDEEDEL